MAALIQYWPAIWQNAFYTFWVTLVGFGMAVVFGLALGLVTGASALTYAALYPMLVGFNSIPKVAIVPVLVVCGSASAPSRPSSPPSPSPSFPSW